MVEKQLPDWDDLPNMPGHPEIRGCGWIWGEDDDLGTVNLLTPEVVKAAAHECIQSCRLDWALNFPERPGLGRRSFHHKIIKRPSGGRDDEITFNAQSGSQIDGLRHYGFHELDTWFNGVSGTEAFPPGEPVVAASTVEDHSRLSIHHWAKHGIQGRGVLLDVERFADQVGLKDFHPFGHQGISADQLRRVAQLEGVEFRAGDILIMRTGLVGAYKAASAEQQDLWLKEKAEFSGVEQSDEMRRFLWNTHFAMVATDAVAFEVMPVKHENGKMLHRDILGLWGCPIGELWELDELAEMCHSKKRWTFFFTSLPLMVIGGVSSPPNAMALF